jgi:hypothetical protein
VGPTTSLDLRSARRACSAGRQAGRRRPHQPASRLFYPDSIRSPLASLGAVGGGVTVWASVPGVRSIGGMDPTAGLRFWRTPVFLAFLVLNPVSGGSKQRLRFEVRRI